MTDMARIATDMERAKALHPALNQPQRPRFTAHYDLATARRIHDDDGPSLVPHVVRYGKPGSYVGRELVVEIDGKHWWCNTDLLTQWATYVAMSGRRLFTAIEWDGAVYLGDVDDAVHVGQLAAHIATAVNRMHRDHELRLQGVA